ASLAETQFASASHASEPRANAEKHNPGGLRDGPSTASGSPAPTSAGRLPSGANARQCVGTSSKSQAIAINLSIQEAVFYRDGCEVGSSPITSGRRGLRTPLGRYHIDAKYSPITFHSPWPTSSPYYFAPETAEYAIHFAAGGFFIHSAPWEPMSAYG